MIFIARFVKFFRLPIQDCESHNITVDESPGDERATAVHHHSDRKESISTEFTGQSLMNLLNSNSQPEMTEEK